MSGALAMDHDLGAQTYFLLRLRLHSLPNKKIDQDCIVQTLNCAMLRT
jgi:hypothetical protein